MKGLFKESKAKERAARQKEERLQKFEERLWVLENPPKLNLKNPLWQYVLLELDVVKAKFLEQLIGI